MRTYHKRKIVVVFLGTLLLMIGLIVRLGWLMLGKAEYYGKKAQDLHERERSIKALRGEIWDRNGTVIAANQTVCTISVIHSQIKEPEKVIQILAEELDMEEEKIRTRVENYGEGPSIYMEVTVYYGFSIIKQLKDFKEKCVKDIEKLTTMSVQKITVIAKSIELPKKGE